MKDGQNVLVIGIENVIGKALAKRLARDYRVMGIATRHTDVLHDVMVPYLLYTGKKLAMDVPVDTVYYVHDYLSYAQAALQVEKGASEMALLQQSIDLAMKTKAKFIYLSTLLTDASQYGERHIDGERRLKSSNINFDIIRVPEVQSPCMECYLTALTDAAQHDGLLICDGYETMVPMIWLDDLVEYLVQCDAKQKIRELLPMDTMSNRELLINIGMMTKSKAKVRPNAVSLPWEKHAEYIDKSFFTISYHEMLKNILPKSCLKNYKSHHHVPMSKDIIYGTLKKFKLSQEEDKLQSTEVYTSLYDILCRNFVKITLNPFNAWGISYLCQNAYLMAIEQDDTDDRLHIYLPIVHQKCPEVPNKWLFYKLESRYIFVGVQNYRFWQYVFAMQDQLGKDFLRDKYYLWNAIERELDYRHYKLPHGFFFTFTQAELQRAADIMQSMDIGAEKYVCLFVRDSFYNGKDANKMLAANSQARNSSIEDYIPVIRSLKESGIKTVRMGKGAAGNVADIGVVDYANQWYEEMLDFYLLQNCRYFISTSSGITYMAVFAAKPLVLINYTQLTMCVDNVFVTNPARDLFIPKKYWHIKEQRFLSLKEIMEFELQHPGYDIYEQYAKAGIEVRNNSAKEITAVVAEMEARLSGRQYTEAEESLQRKYRKILLGEVQKSYMHFINARIGTDFLQRNPWFLQ